MSRCLPILVVAWMACAQSHADLLEDVCAGFEDESSLSVLGDSDSLEDRRTICLLLKRIREEEPGHVNMGIAPWLDPGNGLAFLKDMNFKIKAFENKNLGGENGLGFSYDYSNATPLGEYSYDDDSGVTSGWAWNIRAKGNIAFDSELNPADFLDTRIAISGFRNKWKITETTVQTHIELNMLEDELVEAESQEELAEIRRRQAESGQSVIDAVRDALPVRSYIDFGFHAGLESDQKFDQEQWSYGAQLAIDFKSYDRDAWQTTFNFFDWPFAVIRRLAGYNPGERFQVYGSTIPTLVLGIDQVDPKNNAAREALGETKKFDRYRAEVFFRTPIAYIGNNEVFFNFDYRHLEERDAPVAIEAAGLDEFKYTIVSISSSSGVFVSYRDGKLPFDLEDQQVYEVGWKFNLGDL